MSLSDQLIELTENIYKVDVSNNVMVKKDKIVLLSDDHFDWFAEGVIIYLPDLEAEKGVKYVSMGVSDIYEYDDPKQLPKLYIRSDYHQLINKYYQEYCITDIEETVNEDSEYDFISYAILPHKC